MYETILFPTDGSDAANAALEHALDLAGTYDATLYVINVADTNRDSVTTLGTTVVDALAEEGESVVQTVAERAQERGVDVTTEVLQGDPPTTIADYAEERGIDLLVMGTHGRRGLDQHLLESVTGASSGPSTCQFWLSAGTNSDRLDLARRGHRFVQPEFRSDEYCPAYVALDPRPQVDRFVEGCRSAVVHRESASDVRDPRRVNGRSPVGQVPERHRRPDGVTVDQRGDQPAVGDVRHASGVDGSGSERGFQSGSVRREIAFEV